MAQDAPVLLTRGRTTAPEPKATAKPAKVRATKPGSEPSRAAQIAARLAARDAAEARATSESLTIPAQPAPVELSAAESASVGRRRAATSRRRLPRLVLLSPARIGLIAIALAVTGVFEVGSGTAPPAPVNIQLYSAQANVLNGSGAIQTVGVRTTTPSRSLDRADLQGASPQELEAAAERQALERTQAITSITANAQKFANYVRKNAWMLPIPKGVYVLTARFGQYGIWAGMHTGLDFAAPYGTPITAVASGTVTFAGYDGAYGNQVIETLPNGTQLYYCHMSAFAVKLGDTVIAGQQIGNVGTTGDTTGPHLHLEVRPGGGDPVDPYQALIFHGVQP